MISRVNRPRMNVGKWPLLQTEFEALCRCTGDIDTHLLGIASHPTGRSWYTYYVCVDCGDVKSATRDRRYISPA